MHRRRWQACGLRREPELLRRVLRQHPAAPDDELEHTTVVMERAAWIDEEEGRLDREGERPTVPRDSWPGPFAEATILTKREYKKRTEPIPNGMPTIAQITLWLAELGGDMGPKSSGGPPGSITIKRGLDFVLPIAAVIACLKKMGKLDGSGPSRFR